jgi:hypothetical protein
MRRRSAGLVVGLVAVVLIAGCGPVDREPVPPPSTSTRPVSSPVESYPVAQIAALTPADPVLVGVADTALEAHPAARAAREDSVVAMWAALTDDARFAQYVQMNGVGSDVDVRRERSLIGPVPWIVTGISENPDGSTTVHTCAPASQTQMHKDDGSLEVLTHDFDYPRDITLSPLTAAEVAELVALGLEPPALRVRGYESLAGACDASAAVTQVFVGWRDVAPVGHYRDQG